METVQKRGTIQTTISTIKRKLQVFKIEKYKEKMAIPEK
jgi:hypothetical protein